MKKPQYKSEKNQKIKGSIKEKEPIFQALEFLPVRFYLLFLLIDSDSNSVS